ncbi:hypothetical protein AQPE_1888 [Aquipluma nitroreducens]|uniref:Uncharacterized protein n=1 Tax=Aquipluma nitroreducens TaxID=2010828 RepID=A0A5K7S838_9BACT|nr:hypothetical protein AQPE_1888 [Aquipluma nitroreducens]
MRKPLHCFIEFNCVERFLFIPIFALDNSNLNPLFIKLQHVDKG